MPMPSRLFPCEPATGSPRAHFSKVISGKVGRVTPCAPPSVGGPRLLTGRLAGTLAPPGRAQRAAAPFQPDSIRRLFLGITLGLTHTGANVGLRGVSPPPHGRCGVGEQRGSGSWRGSQRRSSFGCNNLGYRFPLSRVPRLSRLPCIPFSPGSPGFVFRLNRCAVLLSDRFSDRKPTGFLPRPPKFDVET